ncbi:MAG: hypothetical protein ACI955_002765 [Zhongshania sp.]|jgi:hypothetical protein
MKKLTLTTEFLVSQALGSMTISGIRFSSEIHDKMTKIINGEANAGD